MLCVLSCPVAAQVEWTRELHDKFVSAVEALSVDKAVPSKILERMGTCSEGLTRQNIASHLQKYRNRCALITNHLQVFQLIARHVVA